MTRYRTIVADPPWPFTWQGGAGGRRANATRLGYSTMTYQQIQVLPIQELAEDNATLLLWVTQEALHYGTATCHRASLGLHASHRRTGMAQAELRNRRIPTYRSRNMLDLPARRGLTAR